MSASTSADPAAVVAFEAQRAASHLARSSRPPRRTSGLQRTQNRWGWLFVAPAMIGFVLFVLGPMLTSLGISLTDWTIGVSPNLIGVGNYTTIAADPLFWKSVGVTAEYALLAVPGGIVVMFLIALLLHQAPARGRSILRTVFYLPVLVPPVATAVLWLWIFSPSGGLANIALNAVGLPSSNWVFGEDSAVPSIAIMTIWGYGNMALIFLAGLQGVPRDLLEAADIDGANGLQRTWHVTLPQISPIIFFNLVTGLIGAFQAFDAAFVMTNGGPANATLFYVFYLYSKAFTDAQLGYACALAWVLFGIVLIVTLLIFRTARSWVFYEASER